MEHELMQSGEILLYNYGGEKEVVNVVFRDETFWLTQKAMAELFDVNVPAISRHLQNIYEVSAPVIKCKKTPRKRCSFVAERRKKR